MAKLRKFYETIINLKLEVRMNLSNSPMQSMPYAIYATFTKILHFPLSIHHSPFTIYNYPKSIINNPTSPLTINN
jgi:hypothetical protein